MLKIAKLILLEKFSIFLYFLAYQGIIFQIELTFAF